MNICKASWIIGFSIAAATAFCEPTVSETIYVVELSDIQKVETLQTMTKDELKTMTDEIKKETSLFAKAMSAAEKAWKADETNGRKTFPRSAIAQRSIKVRTVTKNPDEASKIIAKFDEKVLKMKQRKEDEEKAPRYSGAQRGGNQRNAAEQQRRMKAEQEKKKKEEQERKVFLDSARAIFQTEMDNLKAGVTAEPKEDEAKAEPAAAAPQH